MKKSLFLLLLACDSVGVRPAETDEIPVGTDEQASLPRLPRSLEDTTPAGAFTAAASGDLVVDASVRERFDHYLSALGEEPLSVVRKRVLYDARTLPRTARQHVASLFDSYIAYREAGSQNEAIREASLEARMARVMKLRRDLLGEDVAAAFFGEEEETDRVFAKAAALPESERAAALERLPRAVREAREASLVPLRMYERERTMTSPEELRQLRDETFGAEARDRLEQLDALRAERRGRVALYKAAAEAMRGDEARTEALFNEIFPVAERARARVWIR